MRVGFYFGRNANLAESWERRFKETLGDVVEFATEEGEGTGCICLLPELNDVDVAIVHPHSDNMLGNCYDECKQVVEAHPDTHFYIFAFLGKTEERKERIGEHENVSFLDVMQASSIYRKPRKYLGIEE